MHNLAGMNQCNMEILRGLVVASSIRKYNPWRIRIADGRVRSRTPLATSASWCCQPEFMDWLDLARGFDGERVLACSSYSGNAANSKEKARINDGCPGLAIPSIRQLIPLLKRAVSDVLNCDPSETSSPRY